MLEVRTHSGKIQRPQKNTVENVRASSTQIISRVVTVLTLMARRHKQTLAATTEAIRVAVVDDHAVGERFNRTETPQGRAAQHKMLMNGESNKLFEH